MAITPKPGERIAHYPTKIEPAQASPTAWLPVILGCNKVCTYCIVPYRRGRERSRPMEELLTEARSLVAKGAKELTLLGQTVEAYGLYLPDKQDLADLMTGLSEIDALERIRFMTSYPRHMTDSMIERMAALPKVCEHLNIPVQAGDDALLKRMKRGYTLDEYRSRIERVRALWPGVSLSTAFEINQQYLHKVEEVLVEDTNVTHGRQQLKGRNRANKLVFFPQPGETIAQDGQIQFDATRHIAIGDMVKVRIERATAWSLQGCAVEV